MERAEEGRVVLEPGEYVLTEAISVADLRGDVVVSPAAGALDEQLRRSFDATGNGLCRNSGSDNIGTSAA